MNLLYLNYGPVDPLTGGVARVTAAQADYFEKKLGYKTWYLGVPDETKRADASRQFYLPAGANAHYDAPENIEFYKNLLKEYKIDVVINQACWNIAVSRLSYAARSANVKLLSPFHNAIVNFIANTRDSWHARLQRRHLGFVTPLLSLGIVKKTFLLRNERRWRKHFRDLCAYSDRLILLSEQFKPELAQYLGKSCPPNVIAISNPYPFAEVGAVDLAAKEKEILFVGRFDSLQKRVDLAIRIWAKLHRDFPDWTFRLLGDGPDFDKTVALAKKLKAERVIFEGFKNAEEYYKKASLLMMTSTHEGFGMVLVEALGAGCIPCAFQSFASVTDIIDDGKNGVLVKPFDCGLYAKKLANLMKNDTLRRQMAANAIEKARKFSTEKIYKKWIDVIEDLCPQAKP